MKKNNNFDDLKAHMLNLTIQVIEEKVKIQRDLLLKKSETLATIVKKDSTA